MSLADSENIKKGLVSVIIPTYKRSDMLVRAINSVLKQSYKHIEVIVVDDNDPNTIYREKTRELMKKYCNDKKVYYIMHSRNINGAAARNTGINNSSGEYISFLDDDDEFSDNMISVQIKKLKSLNDSWGGVCCGCELYKQNTKVKTILNKNIPLNMKGLLLMNHNIFYGSTLILRRKVLEELSGFDESFSRHQDWELMIRVFRRYKIFYINKPLVKRHLDSETNRNLSGEQLEEIKLRYLNKFSKDIEEFELNIRNLVYKKHYYQIMTAYINNKKYKKAYYWYKMANKKSKFTLKESNNIIKIVVSSIINKRFKQFLKRIKLD